MKNKRIKITLFIITFLLFVPLIAMQFTNEVNWGLLDFVIAAVLLYGTALLSEFIIRKIKNLNYRVVIILVLLLALFLIWAELAVGIFGTSFAGE